MHTMPALLVECTREQRLFRLDSELSPSDVDSVNTQTGAVVNPRLLREKRCSSPATLRLYDLSPPPGQTTVFSRRPGCGAACIHACITVPSSALCKDFPPGVPSLMPGGGHKSACLSFLMTDLLLLFFVLRLLNFPSTCIKNLQRFVMPLHQL